MVSTNKKRKAGAIILIVYRMAGVVWQQSAVRNAKIKREGGGPLFFFAVHSCYVVSRTKLKKKKAEGP